MIIGTAGHVDHGKTELVRALTGQDTDRLPEEKRRGISIDLGFARLRLPGGAAAGVVDVPGHERFIRNMVAGATGVDLVLLVVAADEGVMPQTREHLDILDLLGVKNGIIVITKKDLVDGEWLNLVEEEVRGTVGGTFLAGAPLHAVSSKTGEGLERLIAGIEAIAAGVSRDGGTGFARVPVDRVFSRSGFGTIVTGTLLSGSVSPEDRLELLPAGLEVRVRQVQVHGDRVERATAGERVALNLAGVERQQVRRGDVLAVPGSQRPVTTCAADLRLLPGVGRPLRNEARVRLHTGTAEVFGRVLLLDREELLPGDECYVQFRAESPLVVARGDRYLIRTYSPMLTIGGGRVLDAGRRYKRHNPPDLQDLAVLASGDLGGLLGILMRDGRPHPLAELARSAGLPRPAVAGEVAARERAGELVVLGEWVIRSDGYDRLAGEARAQLEGFLARHPLRRGMPREELRATAWPGVDTKAAGVLLESMAGGGLLALDQDLVGLPGHGPRLSPVQREALDALAALYERAAFTPPDPAEATAEVAGLLAGRGEADARVQAGEIFRLLVEQGSLVKMGEGFYVHVRVLEEAKERLRRYLEERGMITMAELRDLFATSRKYAVPLGEYFDRIRLTRRDGDVRRLSG